MNATPSQVMRNLLIAAGLANAQNVAGDWPLTIGNMPSGSTVSNQYISIRNTGSYIEAVNHRSKKNIAHPSVQIMVRGGELAAPELKAQAIEDHLRALTQRTVVYGAYTFLVHAVNVVTPVTWVKQEEQNQRQLYSLNVRLSLEEV